MKNALTTTQHQVTNFSDAFTASIMQAQESAFINRTVALLDEAGMGEHNVYVHWFRIDYGEWMDAEEVVNAGGMPQYLKALGMDASDVQELMSQSYEIQDATGFAAKCMGDQGELDWEKLGEVIEVIGSYFKAA